MSIMRFSAAPQGSLGDRTNPWAVFGERPGEPDGLEANALAGISLAPIAGAPGAPIFETGSLFGAHMAGLEFDLPPGAPVVVFVHGFCYEPRRPVVARAHSDNAHRALYHFCETPDGPGSIEERTAHLTPWFARALVPGGVGPAEAAQGLGVGYCYSAYGGAHDPFLPDWYQRLGLRLTPATRWRPPGRAIETAYMDAEFAGFGLAGVLKQLAARLDVEGHRDQRIDIVAHGLGARAVMSALALLAQRAPEDPIVGRIDRVILMGAALYWGQAAHGLANILFSEVWPRPQFYNITASSDAVLGHLERRCTAPTALAEALRDLTLEGATARLLRPGRVVGRSGKPPHRLYDFFGPDYPEWIDLPLDDPWLRDWGRDWGMDLRPARYGCIGDHGMYFTHPGNWALYRRILLDRSGWSVADMSAEIA